jgi:hypothetical protein
MKIANTAAGWIFFGLTVIAVFALGSWEVVRTDFYRMWLLREYNDDYETLVSMLEHDRALTFISTDRIEPATPLDAGITPQRIADYRRHMSRIGSDAISSSRISILFLSNRIGASDLLYSESDEHPTRPSYRLKRCWFLVADLGPF